MATFDEHIAQAKDNLLFLKAVNTYQNSNWNWQITVSFYVAVHLVNAHIKISGASECTSHKATKLAIAPSNSTGSAMDRDCYVAYSNLMAFSWTARYGAIPMTERQFQKTMKNLDKIIVFMATKYGLEFDLTQLNCPRLSEISLNHFEHIEVT